MEFLEQQYQQFEALTSGMYRDDGYNGGGDGPPQAKRGRRDEVNDHLLRLLIPSKLAGLIIGKGGANVAKLRSQYECQVQIPDSKVPERVVGINCEMQRMNELMRDLLELLVERDMQGSTNREVKMLVQQNQAGSVIGRGGENVKAIRQDTGAHVHINAECCPRSTDRVVTISGSNEQVAAAVVKILEVCLDTPDRPGNVWFYNPAEAYDPFLAQEYGGYSADGTSSGGFRGGQGGGGGGGPPRDFQAPPQQWGPPAGGNYPPAFSGGQSFGGAPARQPWNDRSPPMGGGGGGGRGGGGALPRAPAAGGKRETQMVGCDSPLRFLIPARNAGRLIGKGGDVIGRLRSDFQAQVTIPDSTCPERVVGVKAEDLPGIVGELARLLSDDDRCEVRMLVHQNQAGSVIGRAGSRVKKIREDTGAQVKVFADCCPLSTDRIVVVNGDPEQAAAAMLLIIDDCQETAPRGRVACYDPQQGYDPFMVDGYGGFRDGGAPGGGPGMGRGRGGGRGGGRGRGGPPAY